MHPITAMPPELLAEFDEPVGLGSLLRVDTSASFSVDFVAQQVQAFLRAAST